MAADALRVVLAAAGVVTVVGALVVAAVAAWRTLRTPTLAASDMSGEWPRERWARARAQPQRAGRDGKRVLLLTYGTRGDVQPVVALARALGKHEAGFQVAVCTADAFRKMVEEKPTPTARFISCGVETVEQPDEVFQATSFAGVLRALNGVYGQLADGMYDAAVAFEPDMIMSQAVVRGIGAHIAEKLRVPHWSLHFAPSNTPTYDFPPGDYAASRFRTLNKLKYLARNVEIAVAAVRCGLADTDVRFRTKRLGLPPLPPDVAAADMEREVQIHAYAEQLQPKPRDWPAWVHVVGAFRLEEESIPAPDAALQRFMDARAGRVIYVGFGSMRLSHARGDPRIPAAMRGALRAFDGACVVACAPPDVLPAMEAATPRDAVATGRVFFCSEAPHPWLFPRCEVVVHHGGAGTTAAAAFAGVPQIISPVLLWSDQSFWAGLVERHGVGSVVRVRPPFDKVDALELEDTFSVAVALSLIHI